MTEFENRLIMDYMILGKNIGQTDVFEAVETLSHMDGGNIIDVIFDNRDKVRPIKTDEIPQFSNEKDINNVLRIIIDSGLSDMTNEEIGSYLCPTETKYDARRKYGETHYKFASQLGLTTKSRPYTATEIGIAYYLLEGDVAKQNLMNRLVFSIPFVQHAIIKAEDGQYYMPGYLGEFLAPSTVARRRSNMRKIMSWAYDVTTGERKNLFDNIVWY